MTPTVATPPAVPADPRIVPPSRLLSAQEAGRRLGLSENYVRKLAKTGRLPFVPDRVRPKGAYLFDPEAVAAYAAANPKRGAAR